MQLPIRHVVSMSDVQQGDGVDANPQNLMHSSRINVEMLVWLYLGKKASGPKARKSRAGG